MGVGREAELRVGLFVEDMEESIVFYTRMLVFEVERHEPGDYASLSVGSIILGLGSVSKLPEEGGYFGRDIAAPRRGPGIEIVLEVDDVEGWHERVAASGHPSTTVRGGSRIPGSRTPTATTCA